jgi:D-glycero-alpha-D-manno-heptose-7-phosphate kinase
VIITRTPVRLSFAGGGTDMPSFYEQDGGAVLSTTINKYFYTVITERGDTMLQLISSDLRVLEQVDAVDPSSYAGDLRIPLAVVRRYNVRRGLNIFMASEIPPGTGLGSSASVCVNMIRAIWTLQGRVVNPYHLAEEAFLLASEMLGEPVGKQDEYAASFGGFNEILFDKAGVTVMPVGLDPLVTAAMEQRLLLFFTGSSRRSTEILAEQKRLSLDPASAVTRGLRAIRALVPHSRDALTAGDLETFGTVLHEGWCLKRELSSRISTAAIDDLYLLARSRGAIGGKISGAGGGGFFMLFTREGAQGPVREAMLGRGLKEMHYRFDHHGSRIVYNDPYFDSDETGGLRWSFIQGS